MARKPGAKNRRPENRVRELEKYIKQIRSDIKLICRRCHRIPKGGLVLPFLHEIIKRPDATKALVDKYIKAYGSWCRPCFGKHFKEWCNSNTFSEEDPPAFLTEREVMEKGGIITSPGVVEGYAKIYGEQQAALPNPSALEQLDDLLAEHKSRFGDK